MHNTNVHPLNPVRGVRGRGDELARTKVLHSIEDADVIADIPASRSTVNYVLDECREAGYVDGLSYTDDGTQTIRKVQRAIIDDVVDAYRTSGRVADEDDVSAIVERWTGFAPHPDAADLNTDSREAMTWLGALLAQKDLRPDDVIESSEVEVSRYADVDQDVARWLRDREHPFYLDDCPYDVPKDMVTEIGGDLYEVDV